jgi:hypothetical protein
MPRRKYGRLRKKVDPPQLDNCSRCRSGKYCPIPTHRGYVIAPCRKWKGPEKLNKRLNKKHPGQRRSAS